MCMWLLSVVCACLVWHVLLVLLLTAVRSGVCDWLNLKCQRVTCALTDAPCPVQYCSSAPRVTFYYY